MAESCRILGIVGPSGGGKTTLLDCIAGIERPDGGHIAFDDVIWFDGTTGRSVGVRERRVGYVFQDGLLFDHLTVRRNLAYGYYADRGGPVPEQVAAELEIAHLLDRLPTAASGGERRRIALGRALLSRPQLLLLDEPLTGLDSATAGRVLVFLRRLIVQAAVPTLYVSHSPSDVIYLCDRAIGIAGGRIVFDGDPAGILSVGACSGARELASLRSLIDVRCVAVDGASQTITYETENGVRITALGEARADDVKTAIAVGARDVVLSSHRPEGISARNVYAGRIRRIVRTATMAVVDIDIGARLYSEVGYETLREMQLVEGGEIFAFFKASAVQQLR